MDRALIAAVPMTRPDLHRAPAVSQAVRASLRGAFRALLPPAVHVADSLTVVPGPLHPEEERLIESARPARREQFVAGRACAREALRELGVETFALLAAEDRAPLWPAGITGSITHAGGYCAAAAARQDDLIAVGIDTELIERFAERLWSRVCTARELAWLYEQPGSERMAWVRGPYSIPPTACKSKI